MNLTPFELPALRTTILGRPFYHVETTPSTQTTLKDLASGLSHGLCLLADHQSAGKGTKGRTWMSFPGEHIYMSMAFEQSKIRLAAIPMFNIALGICMVHTLRDLGIHDSGLKWPNDVYLGGKKVCGILSEMIIVDQSTFIIAGLGLNYRAKSRAVLPDDLKNKATILSHHHQELPARLDFISRFLGHLEDYLHDENLSLKIQQDFKALWIYQGQRLSIHDGVSTHVGVANEIDHSGALLLAQDKTKHVIKILSGDIVLA